MTRGQLELFKRTGGPTPDFDRLHDVAAQVENGELVLELRDGGELWLVIRRLEDGVAVHQRPMSHGCESAAGLIIAEAKSKAARAS